MCDTLVAKITIMILLLFCIFVTEYVHKGRNKNYTKIKTNQLIYNYRLL